MDDAFLGLSDVLFPEVLAAVHGQIFVAAAPMCGVQNPAWNRPRHLGGHLRPTGPSTSGATRCSAVWDDTRHPASWGPYYCHPTRLCTGVRRQGCQTCGLSCFIRSPLRVALVWNSFAFWRSVAPSCPSFPPPRQGCA